MPVHATMQRTKPRPRPTPFGVSLRELRTLKQLSLRRLEQLTGGTVHHQQIDALETGKHQDIGTRFASALADALGAAIVIHDGHATLELRRTKSK